MAGRMEHSLSQASRVDRHSNGCAQMEPVVLYILMKIVSRWMLFGLALIWKDRQMAIGPSTVIVPTVTSGSIMLIQMERLSNRFSLQQYQPRMVPSSTFHGRPMTNLLCWKWLHLVNLICTY